MTKDNAHTSPHTPEEHLYLFVREAADLLTSAYAGMKHPMLKDLKDQLLLDDVMVNVAKLRRVMEATPPEAQGNATGKHVEMVMSRERVDALGGYLEGLLDIANGIQEKAGVLESYRQKIEGEVGGIRQLSDTLYANAMASIKGEPVPPLKAEEEAMLMELWDRYSDQIDQSQTMQMYRLTAARADEVTPGMKVLFEENKRMFEEKALPQIALLDYMAANGEIIDALATLNAVQRVAVSIVGHYLGTQARKSNEIPPPPPA